MFEYCLNIFNSLLELLDADSLTLGLMMSVFANVVLILLLLRRNREYNATIDKAYINLLHYAVIKNDIEKAKCAIEKGAKVDAKNPNGMTPLYIAALRKNYNVLELLIQKGANVNEMCPDLSPLFMAASDGDEKLAKILIDNNADINIKTVTRGFTPLFWAAVSNHKNVVDLLVKNGADLNAKDNGRQETTLHEMAHLGKLEIAKILLDNGANVDEEDIEGFTALHVAAESNKTDVAELLIEKGADVNAKSADQSTPFRCSFEKYNLETSLILLQSGASLIDKDEEGNNAMELSLENNAMDVFKTIVAFQH